MYVGGRKWGVTHPIRCASCTALLITISQGKEGVLICKSVALICVEMFNLIYVPAVKCCTLYDKWPQSCKLHMQL